MSDGIYKKLLYLISKILKVFLLAKKRSKIMFIHRHHAHIYRQSDANYKIAIRNNELVYCFLNADQCVFIC